MTKILSTTAIKQAINAFSSVLTALMTANPLSKLPATTVGGASHLDWSGCDI